MPTGYTSDIYDGKELTGEQFIMQCARAFGALIEMRDESMNAKIPEEFKPSDYHIKQLEKAKKELKEYKNMTIKEATLLVGQEHINKIKSNKKELKKNLDMRDRYLNTLSDVLQWQPPTKDHTELKKFAIEQLENSIKFDCDGREQYYSLDIKEEQPEDYINKNIARCLRDIEYHSAEYKKEVDRINDRNKWIKDLRDSLSK